MNIKEAREIIHKLEMMTAQQAEQISTLQHIVRGYENRVRLYTKNQNGVGFGINGETRQHKGV